MTAENRRIPVVVTFRVGDARIPYATELLGPTPDGDDHSLFIWEEGNFSCSCNRACFVAEALGEDSHLDIPCDELHYSVESIVIVATGEVVYRENEYCRPMERVGDGWVLEPNR